jgi:transcriptional regulator with GAF, ATPase, and Fis domain/serine/threonine protein kinase
MNQETVSQAKTISLLKQSDQAVTSLMEFSDGKKYVVKRFATGHVAEARAEYLYLRTVGGDYIVKAVDFIQGENPVIILEYIEGEVLSEYIASKKKPTEKCFAGLAQSLALIHAYGICVNDIKPDNIIVKDGSAFLADLGFATVNLFFEREFRGTPAYAAPEKIKHQTNHYAADVFSFGMTLFFCKHGKTLFDILGTEAYDKAISSEETWQRQVEMLENDSFVAAMLSYNPAQRPRSIDIALTLGEKSKTRLNNFDRAYLESLIFKSQATAVDKLWKKRNLSIDYADEPMVVENLLSLRSESEGRKLLILDEGSFVSQPEEFFKAFTFGYRDKNKYHANFIEWLQEQDYTILLRRNKELNPTGLFDEIFSKTNALQLWIGNSSDIKPVSQQEISTITSALPALQKEAADIRKQVNSAKPFYIRLLLLDRLKSYKRQTEHNTLSDFLAWSQIALPLMLVEQVWEDWHILIQEGMLTRQIIIESNFVRSDTTIPADYKPDHELLAKLMDYSQKAGLYNILGEICYKTGKSEEAFNYWIQYTDVLIRKEFFLSAYEFLRQLKKRVGNYPFELKKKEAFLTRICGFFEQSHKMYEELIANSTGLMKAILGVDHAIVLQSLKRHEEAINCYKNAIDLFRIHHDQKSLFRAMNNLGVVYFDLQRYSDAEQLFNDVLMEAKQHKNIQFEAISYLNLSDLQLKRGEWNRVLYYTDKAIQITKSNEKWNLFSNGSIIKARALFALGQFNSAIDILQELKDNPNIKENLLQLQEIQARQMHFYNVVDPPKAYELADNVGKDISTLHEILQRELFFLNLSRKRYLRAFNYLEGLEEAGILKAFFDSDIDYILTQLREFKSQSELDTYFYYLIHLLRLFPDTAFQKVYDDVQEAITLYSYKPLEYLVSNLNLQSRNMQVWAEFINQTLQANKSEDIIKLVLEKMRQLIKADKYIWLNITNGSLNTSTAVSRNGDIIPSEQVIFSSEVLRIASEQEGFFCLHPIWQFIDTEAHSSVLGLGIKSVCGCVCRAGSELKGMFYCDSTQNIDLDANDTAACRLMFHIAVNAMEKLDNGATIRNVSELYDTADDDTISQTIIGKSQIMRNVYSKINTVGSHNVNVLITGPTGSGKELVAREIHNRYIQNNQTKLRTPFVAVNCAAIPEQLLESELFGYKKGAFTGAVADKKGKLLLADNGTIFLDEIGEMPLLLQSKLLRAIQDKVITPLGSDQDIPVNVRIIAASNQNLEDMVAKNTFRADLFYRLKVMTIELPSLSERKEDIPLLAMSFLHKFNDKFRKNIAGISPETLIYLQNREWKGNVRELENEMERAVLLCNTNQLNIQDFNFEASNTEGSIFRNLPLQWQQFKDYKKRIEDELEKRYIKLLLEEADNNVMTASKLGHLDRMQVYRLMKKQDE